MIFITKKLFIIENYKYTYHGVHIFSTYNLHYIFHNLLSKKGYVIQKIFLISRFIIEIKVVLIWFVKKVNEYLRNDLCNSVVCQYKDNLYTSFRNFRYDNLDAFVRLVQSVAVARRFKRVLCYYHICLSYVMSNPYYDIGM
jgi:hypothetical protein